MYLYLYRLCIMCRKSWIAAADIEDASTGSTSDIRESAVIFKRAIQTKVHLTSCNGRAFHMYL